MIPAELRGHVVVAGAGVSGVGCARLLHDLGARVTVVDDRKDVREEQAAKLGVASWSGEEALANLAQVDIVITSPGWRPDSPLLVAAAQQGIDVIGDVELAFRLDRAQVFGPPRTWLAVTGTNGKTTTTGMLTAIMEADSHRTGRRAVAVGNIGRSVFDALADTDRVDVLVAELSSFQLHWSQQLRPDVGVLLNLADDHLDWHGGFEGYAGAKAKILTGAHAVIAADDPKVVAYAQGLSQKGTLASAVTYFSASAPHGDNAVGVEDLDLVSTVAGEKSRVCSLAGIEPAGAAGIYDAAAAAAVALAAGADAGSIDQGLHGYRVAGHRGAIVHEANGVRFVDNSKATNPHATESALDGLDSVVWIAGGQLKGADIAPLISAHAHRLRAVVVLGVDQDIIAQALRTLAPEIPVHQVATTQPQEAMDEAVAAARSFSQPGDTVLLAPAAASLDMYIGMGQRGDMFAQAAASH